MSRRQFLVGLAGGVGLGGLASRLLAQTASPAVAWDAGRVRHLLPTASDSEFLIKASFDAPLSAAPVLEVDGAAVNGVMSDTEGEMWRFHATGLDPARRYRLLLRAGRGDGGAPLCDPWELATFPAPEAPVERARVLLYTCAGGDERQGFLPAASRNRLLRRGLAFAPDAVIANGDHVYWDLRTKGRLRGEQLGANLAGLPDRVAPALGGGNERFLKAVAAAQITPVYGVDFRSTPMFFIQDDHDYFDNDEASDRLITFPPDHFMSQMARATQRLYYPEFLPDAARPAGLPGASADGVALPVSESFGTLRIGRLLEMLLYTVRRGMTLAGPSAVFFGGAVESWLTARMAAGEVDHVVNVPSSPPGWSAGKWGEWYPDRLGPDGALSLSPPKPYWQEGWVKQHDRLLAAMSAMRGRVPLVLSGDLHATALGRILRTGETDLSANPVVAALCGTIGTGPSGWPSHSRRTPPRPSLHLRMEEWVAPIEQHGFALADFTPEAVTLSLFKWDRRSQSPEAIDTLEPFHIAALPRPG